MVEEFLLSLLNHLLLVLDLIRWVNSQLQRVLSDPKIIRRPMRKDAQMLPEESIYMTNCN